MSEISQNFQFAIHKLPAYLLKWLVLVQKVSGYCNQSKFEEYESWNITTTYYE